MIHNEKPKDKKVKESKKNINDTSICYTCMNSDYCDLQSDGKKKCKKYKSDF